MKYVEVCQINDFVESTQVKDILEQEGILVRAFGPSVAADIGIGGLDTSDWRIEVPERNADEAIAIINAFLSDIHAETEEELPWELREGEDGRLSLSDPGEGGELALSDESGRLSRNK